MFMTLIAYSLNLGKETQQFTVERKNSDTGSDAFFRFFTP
jgi:hypothetical protein